MCRKEVVEGVKSVEENFCYNKTKSNEDVEQTNRCTSKGRSFASYARSRSELRLHDGTSTSRTNGRGMGGYFSQERRTKVFDADLLFNKYQFMYRDLKGRSLLPSYSKVKQ
jgi:hypothetical protein